MPAPLKDKKKNNTVDYYLVKTRLSFPGDARIPRCPCSFSCPQHVLGDSRATVTKGS